MDVFPVFQVSPEIDGYLPTSPAILGQDSLPLGASGSLDSLTGGPVMTRSLVEQATDLLQLSPPLIPLPYDLLLLPLPVPLRPQSSPGYQSPMEPLASVDSSRMDLALPVGLTI